MTETVLIAAKTAVETITSGDASEEGTAFLVVNAETGALLVEGGTGGGDATAANQSTQITAANLTNTKIGEVATNPTANTLLARVKDILTQTVLAAGSAIIGKVGIDQTTPFTTNAVTIVGAITKTDRSGTITTGGTSQTLMALNSSRKGWQLQNNSMGTIAFNELGSAASLTSGSFILQPGASYESPVGATSTAQINVIGATTGQAFTAREW